MFNKSKVKRKTIVYVDGFNLYYGALKGRPHRWLNIQKLFETLLQKNDILKIKYFSALVERRDSDVSAQERQKKYLRALRTLGKVDIVMGQFQTKKSLIRLAELTKKDREKRRWNEEKTKTIAAKNGKKIAWVHKTEEKSSDVNLATELVNDAHLKKFEVAVVVSNDSDFRRPIEIVSKDIGLPVGIINPQKYTGARLRGLEFYFQQKIRQDILRRSQFPDEMKDKKGIFYKPKEW